ncbi:MBL fold metallo-hydrolase [Myxococcus sp. RHSTA-1-4]|uniref:MBL fold metallo-hydrolase n=1 Tax=Myxococcus sp. RHSTA-1-4 TaxID=2874601 RepID=UPI001CBE3324|nr:MBL fold metallo-hydrolase [Myxococcus sp. RHSTA-1-4]MBZ4421676.1 MBL fold metallo-hydrolase [Myxococcus sp. RHSTA-1-4]
MSFTMRRWVVSLCAVLAVGCAGSKANLVDADVARYTSDANGFDTHSFFYDTGAEVVVFDAQFTEAEARKVLAAIRAKTGNPIRYVVVTHPNPDKFNGVGVFQREGAKVVASEATAAAIPAVHAYKKYFWVNVAKMFTEETYPAQATVDVTFRGTYALPLEGDARVELTELKHPGVTTTQTVAYVPGRKALIVGDLVHHKTHAWLEGGLRDGKVVPDVEAWKAAVDELAAWPEATVYGGRGEAAPVTDAITAQKQYLDGMVALVNAYAAELGSRKAELCGDAAAPHHAELQKRAAAAFPDYALPYMVGYGVYGLVNQLACGG